jgi:hypothetical protein
MRKFLLVLRCLRCHWTGRLRWGEAYESGAEREPLGDQHGVIPYGDDATLTGETDFP